MQVKCPVIKRFDSWNVELWIFIWVSGLYSHIRSGIYSLWNNNWGKLSLPFLKYSNHFEKNLPRHSGPNVLFIFYNVPLSVMT